MGAGRPGLAEIASFHGPASAERSEGCVLGNEFGMIILTSGKRTIERLIKDLDICVKRQNWKYMPARPKRPVIRSPAVYSYKLIATSIDHQGFIRSAITPGPRVNIDDI